MENSQPKLVRVSIIIAIVIVMNLFFNYAISLVYNEPTYDQFIKTTQVVENIATKDECLKVGGQWSTLNQSQVPPPLIVNSVINKTSTGYCDPNYTNQKNYDAARKVYDRNVFITLVILGVLSLVAGAFVTLSILSLAFSWGGVLSLIIASMRYWNSADNIVKVIILGVALCALIWLAVKKFSK